MKVCRKVDDMFREFVGGGNYVNIKLHYTRKFCILFFLKKAIRNISLGITQSRKVYFMVVQQQIYMQNLHINRRHNQIIVLDILINSYNYLSMYRFDEF